MVRSPASVNCEDWMENQRKIRYKFKICFHTGPSVRVQCSRRLIYINQSYSRAFRCTGTMSAPEINFTAIEINKEQRVNGDFFFLSVMEKERKVKVDLHCLHDLYRALILK